MRCIRSVVKQPSAVSAVRGLGCVMWGETTGNHLQGTTRACGCKTAGPGRQPFCAFTLCQLTPGVCGVMRQGKQPSAASAGSGVRAQLRQTHKQRGVTSQRIPEPAQRCSSWAMSTGTSRWACTVHKVYNNRSYIKFKSGMCSA
jgi:hypothetical protein